MKDQTFEHLYCDKHQIDRAEFARSVMRRAVHPKTRLVKWALAVFNPDHFTADFDLVYGVAGLRRLRDFEAEVERFNDHPANRGWLRRKLGLRISTGRLRTLIRETLPRSRAALPTNAANPDRN